MSPAVLWSAAALLPIAFWLRRLVRVRDDAARPLRLSPGGCLPAFPPVTVVVAARNEERSIRACVEKLLKQDYPNLDIVVANDRSTDGTAAILEELQARADARLTVTAVDSLPPGWAGKNNAICRALRAARGEWLCFTDADCTLESPQVLSQAVLHCLESRLDFFSLIPDLDADTVWERIIQPVCCLVLMSWTRPHKVSDPATPHAYANGAFMLIRRTCYDAIGGHERVRAELNEDLRLAQLAKRSGHHLGVAGSHGACRTRMYSSVARMWRGWTRIFCGCSDSVGQLAGTAALLSLVAVLPCLALASAAALGLGALPVALWTAAVGLELWAIAAIHRRTGAKASVAGFPLGAAAVVAMLCSATLKKAGLVRVVWRGTSYRARAADPQLPEGVRPDSIGR